MINVMKRGIAGALAIVAAIALLAGCGTKEQVKHQNTITLPANMPRTLDSTKASDIDSFRIISNTQETLLIYKQNKLINGSVKNIKVSDSGLVYTFMLRPNILWSDGVPLRAQDYEFAFKRLLDPKNKNVYAFFLSSIKNAKAYMQGEIGADEVGIKSVDDLTLEITLENIVPYFEQLLAFPVLSPLRQDVVERVKNYGENAQEMVFSGAFVVKEWNNKKVVLLKNQNYHNAKHTNLDEVIFLNETNLKTVLDGFKSGEIDFIYSEGNFLNELNRIEELKEAQKTEILKPSTYFLEFDFASKNKLLQSRDFRLALALAIDREKLTKALMQKNIPAYAFVSHNVNIEYLIYRDLVPQQLLALNAQNQARQLLDTALKEAGLSPSKFKRQRVNIYFRKNIFDQKLANFIKQNLKSSLGIDAKIVVYKNQKDYKSKVRNSEINLIFSGWSADFNDPLTFLNLFSKDNGNNTSGYFDEAIEEKLGELSNINDYKRRLKLYEEIENILVLQNPAIIPLYYVDEVYFIKPYLKDVYFGAYGSPVQLRFASIKNGKN